MTERVVLFVQMSIAFDHEGNRSPQLDDCFIEDCGLISSDMAEGFGKNGRYPGAIQITRLTPTEVEAWDKSMKVKFDPEAGCHPLK